MGLWVIFGIISICGALTLAELASMIPRTGGLYVYLREAYGEGAAFVFGWLYTAVTAPAAIAALATISVEFFLSAIGAPIPNDPTGMIKLGAAVTIAALAVVNILGTKLGSTVQAVMTGMQT